MSNFKKDQKVRISADEDWVRDEFTKISMVLHGHMLPYVGTFGTVMSIPGQGAKTVAVQFPDGDHYYWPQSCVKPANLLDALIEEAHDAVPKFCSPLHTPQVHTIAKAKPSGACLSCHSENIYETRSGGIGCSDCGAVMGLRMTVQRDISLKVERDALLEMTRLLEEHPEGYDGPCECMLCCSYGAEDAEGLL